MKYLPLLLAFVCKSVFAMCFVGGDSLSLGQKPFIFDAFPNEVVRNPGNGRDTWHWLDKSPEWFSTTQYKIIYFDVGMWDIAHRCPTADNPWTLCPAPAPFAAPITTTPSQFHTNIIQIVGIIRNLQPNALIILASITPVPDGADGRTTADGVSYNSVLTHTVEGVNDPHVMVDHLSSVIGPYDNLHKTPTNVHYTSAGYQILANHVIDVINSHGGC